MLILIHLPTMDILHYRQPTDKAITEFGSSSYGGHFQLMDTNDPPQINAMQLGCGLWVNAMDKSQAQAKAMEHAQVPAMEHAQVQAMEHAQIQAMEAAPQISNTMEVTTVQPLLLLSSIRVDGAWDVEFMTHLESLNVPKLLHFFMDLANITWSHIFTHPVMHRPTVDVC